MWFGAFAGPLAHARGSGQNRERERAARGKGTVSCGHGTSAWIDWVRPVSVAAGAIGGEPARVPVRGDGGVLLRVPIRGLPRWFLPDVAMAVACVTLFYCLFLYQGYRNLFRDSDAGWHIRSGVDILRTLRLPRTDPYSFTREGTPWFAWEWAADAVDGRRVPGGRPGRSSPVLCRGDRRGGLAVVPPALGHGRRFPAGLRHGAA